MTDDPQLIHDILAKSHVIAVVGLSAQNHRPSYGVARYMQAHGYRIIPVNPKYAGTYILDELCYATLAEANTALAKENLKIDIVDCFRQSSAIEPIADDAIAIGAKCLWMQLGVINDVAAQKAEHAGMTAVADRCIKVDHMNSGLA
jgi:hypothetical protein